MGHIIQWGGGSLEIEDSIQLWQYLQIRMGNHNFSNMTTKEWKSSWKPSMKLGTNYYKLD